LRTNKIDFFFDIVFSVLLFSLSFSIAIPNILLGILIILFFLKNKRVLFTPVYIKLLSLFCLFLILKAIFFNSLLENIIIYKFLLVLLIVSVLIFNIKNVRTVIKGYVFGVFLGVIISSIKISLYYFRFKTLPFGNTSEVQNLILIHRPYFGFMCLLAIVLIIFLLSKINSTKEKIVYILMTILILFFLNIIVARLSLLLSFLYLIISVLMFLALNKTQLVLSLFFLSLLFLTVFRLNKNLKNRLHLKNTYTETINVLRNQEPRFVIWDCVINQINNKDFNGYFGYENRKTIQNNLNDCYNSSISNVSKKEYYSITKFNSHNQFFDIFLDGGVVGTFLFLILFIFSMYSFRNNFDAIFILFSFLLFLVFENIFQRQIGTYLFGIFIPLFHKIITSEE
jgi:O-antigen ligase